jgi:hypothetical protein
MTELATTEKAAEDVVFIIDLLHKGNPHRRFDVYTEQILYVAKKLNFWEKTYQRSFIKENLGLRELADYKRISYGVAMKWIVNRANLLEL